MADFTPDLQAEFTRLPMVDLMMTPRYDRPRKYRMLQWKGTLRAFLSLRERAQEDDSLAGQLVRKGGEKWSRSNSWAGVNSETCEAFIKQGFSTDAKASFQRAVSKMDITYSPSRNTPAVTGGLWNVPRSIQNHPLSAIRRPKTALPVKNWDITASFMAMTSEAEISAILAKLAKAAWDYKLQGGVVNITIHYVTCFSRKRPDGAEGILWSIIVPLTDISALATTLSVQLFRIGCLSLAQGLTGVDGYDGIPVPTWNKPGACPITGIRREDEAAVKKILSVS